MSASRAFAAGLANTIVPVAGLDAAVEEYLARLAACGPQALRVTKELLREVPRLSLAEARVFTAKRIAQQRISGEGLEGTAAFLEKRKPSWMKG